MFTVVNNNITLVNKKATTFLDFLTFLFQFFKKFQLCFCRNSHYFTCNPIKSCPGIVTGNVTGLPVKLWDERRTTVEAHNILSEHNYHGKKRKNTVDAVAASLILEGYLNFKKR